MDRNRILILFGVAWVSAALLTWFLYSSTQAPKQAKRTAIVAAVHDLPVGTILHKADLKTVNVLPADLPKGAVAVDKEAIDHVVLYPVNANEPLVTSKLSKLTGAEGIQATIDPGHRAVSVQITDVSGVAGLIAPGARVDVLFTRTGNMAEALTSTILQNVQVLAIGRAVQIGQTIDPKAAKVPVATLVVTPAQAQVLELAKNEGKISLSLRNPLDPSADLDGTPVTGIALDPSLKNKKPVRNLNADGAFEDLSGGPRVAKKEPPPPPPPPRAVVDVFRGDKHVQEVFK